MKNITKKPRSSIVFFLNGQRHEVNNIFATMMLGDYLRYNQQLTGTKIVCAEGDCGACSVLRLYRGAGQRDSRYQAINSCITTVAQMDCSSLLTVEYLGSSELDVIQSALVRCHASQCGFCTPGFVIALRALSECKQGQKVTERNAKNALTGNLCRCTGYKQILDAALDMGKSHPAPLCEAPWHGEMEKTLALESKRSLLIKTETFAFFAPITLNEAFAFLSVNPTARIIGAGTDLGVHVTKHGVTYPTLLSLHLIPELYQVQIHKSRVKVGARVTLDTLRKTIKDSIPSFTSYLDLFASPQIKNVATLVGNLCNASPIGDTLPFLLAMDATVQIQGKRCSRKLPVEKFFKSYRTTAIRKGELVVSIEFDVPTPTEKLFLYKSSQRKDLDISAINGTIRLGPKMVRIALGGVAATPIRLKTLEEHVRSSAFDQNSLDASLALLQKEIKPVSDLRGSSTFRRVLAKGFLKSALLAYNDKGQR